MEQNEQVISFLVGSLTAMLSAILTYYFGIKSNQKTSHNQIITEQKYHYFLPFKYQAQELLNRVMHIERRLSENQPEMKSHFQLSLEGKQKIWFFKDWIDFEKLDSGGYFLVSTMYMNCLLYNRMKVMQDKFPYIIAKLTDSLEKQSLTNDKKIKYYVDKIAQDDSMQASDDYRKWLKYENEINLTKIVAAIRVATIMRKGEGIPFGLHYSFGDFLSKNDDVLNFEEFCALLLDPNERIKFYPLVNFWTTLVDQEGNVNIPKLNKLRGLILALKLVNLTELK